MPARWRPSAYCRRRTRRRAGPRSWPCRAVLPDARSASAMRSTAPNRPPISTIARSLGCCSGGNMFCDPMEACDVYTRQCSTLVTAVDLAVAGATLANGGTNPLTHEAVLKSDNVPPILAEMMMEGLYDSAGDWAFEVGVPAKSGVGGGLVAVVPGKLAIAGFAPPLDAVGNSVKAQAGVAAIAKALGCNLFRADATA